MDQSTSFGPEEVVRPNNVLSKFVYFERTLIQKNVKKTALFKRTAFERKK